jgi:hypothetical protein
MPNPLTGDFEAVLQVSGPTINRLLASMHQNAGAKPKLPSFPHAAAIRIGEGTPIDGVRGRMRLQIGVPRVTLIHGSSDRFQLDVGIRARYVADAGTTPLAEFIHGTVHAEYRISDIDPNCAGWGGTKSNYIWVRVVKDSVRFTGTAMDDVSPFAAGVSGVDDAAMNARITKQIAHLLATQFEATPHPVSKRFQRGAMRSLSAPIGGSAVAVPIELSGPASGAITSVNNLLLDGSDFAVGVRLEYLMAMVEPTLAEIRAYTASFKTTISPWVGPDIIIRHTARVTSATVNWEAHGTHALLKIRVEGRVETTSIFTDLSFSVDQVLGVTFDPGAEVVRLFGFAPGIKVTADGLGATQDLTDKVAASIKNAIKPKVDAAVSNVQPSFAGSKTELIAQLKTLDDQADLWFDQGVFTPYGVVLRGTIALTPRTRTVVTYDESVEGDGYTALLGWIPGGRIDKLEWTWSWFGSGKPGTAIHDDRFLLRRPQVLTRARWGAATALAPTQPLPGLDGMGILCLKIKGVRVDSMTGDLVPIESGKHCTRFGFPILVETEVDRGRLFWKTWREPELSRDVPFPELALVEAGGGNGAEGVDSNTLLLYVGRQWDRETAATLMEGLERSRREDAGLKVVVLFREGSLETGRSDVAAEVEQLAQRLGAHVVVNEDVRGAWSSAFAIRSESGDQAWRLIAPRGGVTWTHDGRIHGEMLAKALDLCLIPSAAPKPAAIRTLVKPGMQLGATALHPGFSELIEAENPCPPLHVSRTAYASSVVTFVQRASSSSHAQLRELARQFSEAGEDAPFVVVVIDGANAREVEALKNELGVDFAAIPDTSGAIANRFGVRTWPTTVTIDGTGTVSDVEVGHQNEPRGVAQKRRSPDD